MNKQRITTRSPLGLLVLLGLILFCTPISAQVFDPGPSDPALFDNVINVPTDPDIGSFEVIGGDGLTTQLNVSDGGLVGSFFDARSGAEVNISGGSVGDRFVANSGSEVNISGGAVGPNFIVLPGSDVELIGGEFLLNGVAFSGAAVSLNDGDILTGTLTDGSTFVFFDRIAFSFTDGNLTSGVLPTLDLQPVVVSTANPNLPSGLRTGQTLTLQDGGELGANFAVVEATLNVEGGSLGDNAGATNNSVVNISGGSIGSFFSAYTGSEINISGGSVGAAFGAQSGSVVNISGGTIGFALDAFPGSEINISGGTVPNSLRAHSGSVINLLGSDFFVDGVSLDDGLTTGEAFTIVDRGNAEFSALLADGTPISFDLGLDNLAATPNGGFFSSDATLTVTLVAPPEVILGDCNLDGEVTFADIPSFIAVLAAGSFLAEADCNLDDEVTFADIGPFIAILSSN